MAERKRLSELTIKDNFIFGAVMIDEDICKGLLERILQIPIERVQVSKEKSIVYHPEYKGVRLDVFASDEMGTHYDIGMQVLQKPAIEKRSRYYHSQMDMEFLRSGEEYAKLPNSYVIFICDYDPFGRKKYCYTFQSMCREEHDLVLQDGRTSIFLSTNGENDHEIPKELVKFLQFVKSSEPESRADFQDEFVEQIQKSIHNIKKSREMEERFMLFQELLNDERAEGRAEGAANSLIIILSNKGSVPDDLRENIVSETDFSTLTRWIEIASRVDTIEKFQSEM